MKNKALVYFFIFLSPLLYSQVSEELLSGLGKPGWSVLFFNEFSQLQSWEETQVFLKTLIDLDPQSREKIPIQLYYYLSGEMAYQERDWTLARHYWAFGSHQGVDKHLFYRRLAELEMREGNYEEALSWIYLLENNTNRAIKEVGIAFHGLVHWLQGQSSQGILIMDQYTPEEGLPGSFFLKIRALLEEDEETPSPSLERLLASRYPGSLVLFHGLSFRPFLRWKMAESGSIPMDWAEPEQQTERIASYHYQIAAYTNNEYAMEKYADLKARSIPVRLGEKTLANRYYTVIYIQSTEKEWENNWSKKISGFRLPSLLKEIQPVQSE